MLEFVMEAGLETGSLTLEAGAVQAQRAEFESQQPHKEPGPGMSVCNPNIERWDDLWDLPASQSSQRGEL